MRADQFIAESTSIRNFYKNGPYRHCFYEQDGKWYVRGQERKEEETEGFLLATDTLSIDQLFDVVDGEEVDEDL